MQTISLIPSGKQMNRNYMPCLNRIICLVIPSDIELPWLRKGPSYLFEKLYLKLRINFRQIVTKSICEFQKLSK